MKHLFLLALFNFSVLSLLGQSLNDSQEYVNQYVKTVQIKPSGSDFGYPVCDIDQSLTLSFDIIEDKFINPEYKIVHCNADFTPDDLSFYEFAQGFENRLIKDYKSSFNTHVSYTHYELVLPDNDFGFLISGNYIIYVYPEDDPSNIIIKKRFMICQKENAPSITAEALRPFDASKSFDCQEVDVELDLSRTDIINPEKYLAVYVCQNGNPNSFRKLDASYIGSQTVRYQNRDANIFPGICEYRKFDAKDVNFSAQGIEKIYYADGIYNYLLDIYKPTTQRVYSYSEDLDGAYYIKNDRGFNNDVESDYVKVKFRLNYDAFTDGEVYVTGGLTDYALNGLGRCTLNPQTGLWETELLLKQGLYNFDFVDINKSNGNVIYPSGSWYNTENDYLICVYLTDPSQRGQKLINYIVINSVK